MPASALLNEVKDPTVLTVLEGSTVSPAIPAVRVSIVPLCLSQSTTSGYRKIKRIRVEPCSEVSWRVEQWKVESRRLLRSC